MNHTVSSKPEVRAYGEWKSPISAADVATGRIHLGQTALDGDWLYWCEVNPADAGRTSIHRWSVATGVHERITPPNFYARTRAREYGGGSMVAGSGIVAASRWEDQRLYLFDHEGNAQPLTPECIKDIPGYPKPSPALRYADGVVDMARNRIITICEDITAGANRPIYSIVAVPLDGSMKIRPLIVSHSGDMYMSLALSPDASQLAYIAWTPPAMPWRSSRLMVAEIREEGGIVSRWRKAGEGQESIAQPLWFHGRLWYLSDHSGYWNPWFVNDQNRPEQAVKMRSDFAQPQWFFGLSHWANAGDAIVCSYIQQGFWRLGEISGVGKFHDIPVPFTEIRGVRADQDRITLVGASPTRPAALVQLNRGGIEQAMVRQSAREVEVLDTGGLSVAQRVMTRLEDGNTVYGWFYPPTNEDFEGPADEKPPLYVRIHGGPEESASTEYSPEVQFWTTRGFGFLDVDHPGSTRYGRGYRDLLIHQWGVIDRLAARALALHSARHGYGDRNWMIIAGCSAGGYTALNEMANDDGVFAGAIAIASIADLIRIAQDTGGFEGGNTETLIGDRNDTALWQARSPWFQRHNIRKPILFIHGVDDGVTPIDQIREMVADLQRRGIHVATFFPEEEQHGLRQPQNIQRAMEMQLGFVAHVCGFTAPEEE